jgi:mRNA-degrading endonuclease RelE of RelBE toxin-antitoxin system
MPVLCQSACHEYPAGKFGDSNGFIPCCDNANGVVLRVATLRFIESPVYSSQIDELLSSDEHRMLQLSILEQPESGDVIRGSGGLRKPRLSVTGSGKRGGIRVIYYLHHRDTVYLLFAYRKNRQEDLTGHQLKLLKQLIEHYTHEK